VDGEWFERDSIAAGVHSGGVREEPVRVVSPVGIEVQHLRRLAQLLRDPPISKRREQLANLVRLRGAEFGGYLR